MKQKWINILNICITLALISCLVFCGVTMMYAARKLNVETDFNLEYQAPRPIIGTLFDTTEKKFNRGDLNQLLQQISGDPSASASNLKPIEDLLKVRNQTSEDFRGFNGEKDITVKLGGYTWTTTYLSTDTDGNPILTLWMKDSRELRGKTYDTSKTFDSYGTASWSSGWKSSSTSVDYPSAMYGTSYMSAVVLNNGGQYAHSTSNDSSDISLIPAEQNENSAFALFTMEEFGLTNYLVTPENVGWQKDKQSAKTQLGESYNLPNENWGDINVVPNDGFYSSSYNYANKGELNSAWNNDYLWLPSLSETGYANPGAETGVGLWETSADQRKNSANSWVRSGSRNYVNSACFLNSSGGFGGNFTVNSSCAVRPALHLNLASAANNTI